MASDPRYDYPELGPEIPGKCNAKVMNRDKRCALPAGWGTDHVGVGNCRRHLGNTPAHRRSAQKVMTKQAVEAYGIPREVDPHTALLEEVHRAAGNVAWLEMKIRSFEDAEDLIYSGSARVRQPDGTWKAHPFQSVSTNPWLAEYGTERNRLVKACKTAIACGIAERAVKLAEEHGQVIAGIITDFAARLAEEFGFDPGDARVRRAARGALMAANDADAGSGEAAAV